MNLLVLGGTTFLGPHVVDAALQARHEIWVFHRGKTPFAFKAGVTERFGDRTTADIESLTSQHWDAVIDTSGYDPPIVMRSARGFRESANRYLFVSTISVYANLEAGFATEETRLHPPEAVDDGDAATRYGARKAACEEVVRGEYADRATVVRPGLIVGPYDPTDRFTYWVERLSRGGTILAPGRPSRAVQCIDVRDLAAWMIALVENETPGTYHAAGREMPMETFFQAGLDALRPERAELAWIPDSLLLEAGVAPWSEMPLWLPDDLGLGNMMTLDDTRALATGLRFRDIRETFAATNEWAKTVPETRQRRAGLTPERERQLLSMADVR